LYVIALVLDDPGMKSLYRHVDPVCLAVIGA
jgi:hypothetical protein